IRSGPRPSAADMRNESTAASLHDPQPIAFDDPGIELWLGSLARTPDEIDELTPWLSPAERARSLRFGTEALRHRWIASRTTLRLLLGRALGVAPAAVEIRRGVRGRPELADPNAGIDFNVSHTGDAALIGIARGLSPQTRIG